MRPGSPSRRVAPRFVLASGSPRRRELLERASYEFEVAAPEIDEVFGAWFTIRELTTSNAALKARAIARRFPNAVVLSADTLVVLEASVIGKPANLEEARKILRHLSGRTHEVCTAVSVCHAAAGRTHTFHEISRVHFRTLTDRTITRYLAKVNPLDKAGAYAAQGHGTEIIERVEGSFSNVVGLPMEETARVLRAFGIRPGCQRMARRLKGQKG